VQNRIVIATRGSALALAQTNGVAAACRRASPDWDVEIKIIKTTGDKLQTASLSQPDPDLPKGLFTKELELALLAHEADLAVHSLKDLPTDLPEGLALGAVTTREDARDVLIFREFNQGGMKLRASLADIPLNGTVATSSTRRRAQLLTARPDLNVVEVRGNVGTRLRKIAETREWHATILAVAGLKRLGYRITPGGKLQGEDVPAGLLATRLDPAVMLPAVGQGAVGLEIRAADERLAPVCARLNDRQTLACVTAERSFLKAMGGGCQSPVAGYAVARGPRIWLRAVAFDTATPRRAHGMLSAAHAQRLGEEVAAKLKAGSQV
jgi:hydroxymethylbilane synthase